MLFFIDESWKFTPGEKHKVGVLAAIQVKSHDFNKCSQDIYTLKRTFLGNDGAHLELKGTSVLRSYLFNLEVRGVRSRELDLVRAILKHMSTLGTNVFASVVFSEEERDLACADANALERPFFFLFERINIFMEENYPGLVAKLVFDDRGYEANQKISKAVSNFFHKSRPGRLFDRILKVPFFAISRENVGIQVADFTANILAKRFAGSRKEQEFFNLIKSMLFKSRTTREVGGRQIPWDGLKVIKEKERGAGDLAASEETAKPMRRPESPPPTPTPTSLPAS